MADTYSTRSLRELAQILFSRWIGILVILAVVIVGVIVVSRWANWAYRSRAMLMARPAAPLTDLQGSASARERISLFVVTQRELIRSDHVVVSALLALDGVEPDGPPAPNGMKLYTDETVRGFADAHPERVAQGRGAVRVETPGGPDVTFTQTYDVVITWPEERGVAARQGRPARELAVERCQAFAEKLLTAYMARRSFVEARHAQQSAEFLLNQATVAAKANLDKAGDDLERFAAEVQGDLLLIQNMLGGIGEMGPQSVRTKFQTEMRTIEARLGEIQALNDAIDVELAKPPGEQVVVPLALIKSDPGLARIQEAIVKLQLKLNELRPRYTAGYKEIQETQAELDANLAFLRQELQRQKLMHQQEAAVLAGRADALDKIVQASRAEIARLASKAARYEKLRETLASAQAIYNKRMEDAVAAQNAQAMAAVQMEVFVVDPPSRPAAGRPHRPILWLNTVVGVLAAVILALIYAFMADHLDHTLRGGDDVQRYAGAPVLASVPRYRGRIIRAKGGAS